MSLPKRCSYQESYLNCTLPPSYIISIQEGEGEFLLGVFCESHKRKMEMALASELRGENIPGKCAKIEKLRFVSTECVRTCVTNQPIPDKYKNVNDSRLLNEGENS